MWNSTRVAAFVWLTLLALCQNVFHFLFPGEIFPFLLIGVIFYALSEGPVFGFSVGCFAGFFMDLLGATRIGPQMLAFGTMGLLVGGSASTVFRDSLWTQFFFPALLQFGCIVFNRLVIQNFDGGAPGGFYYFGSGAEWRSLVLTVLCSPFFFRFLKSVSFASRERGLRWR